MLHYRKSSLLRKKYMACCLGGPGKYEVKLPWFWNRVHKYWLCFLAVHLIWIFVMVYILLSYNGTSTVVPLMFNYSIPGRPYEVVWACVLPWRLEGQPPWVATPCWPVQCLPAPGQPGINCVDVGGWGEAPLSKGCTSDTQHAPMPLEEACFRSSLFLLCSLQAGSSILKAPFRWNFLPKHVLEKDGKIIMYLRLLGEWLSSCKINWICSQ